MVRQRCHLCRSTSTPRTGDPSSATPVAQIVADDTPRIELAPKVETPPVGTQLGPMDKLGRAMSDVGRGLRHRLPFFGRKRG